MIRSVLTFIFCIALLSATAAYAWNADAPFPSSSSTSVVTYKAPPQSAPPVSPQRDGAVVYSTKDYPTAQGQYLSLPSGYVSAAPKPVYAQPASAVTVAPVTAPVSSVSASPSYSSSTPALQSRQLPQDRIAPTSASPTSLTQLPGYTYDRSLDPRYLPKTPVIRLPNANEIPLTTQSGGELGVQVSDYRYQEFGPDGQRLIRITGGNFGATFDANQIFGNHWFMGEDVRLFYGTHKYTGGDININTGQFFPSTHDGTTDLLIETRLLGGHDFMIYGAFWNAFDLDLSPYAGLGFRYLFADDSGQDSNGVSGYKRFSHYIYLPIGVTSRIRLAEKLRLSANMEIDDLLHGWQVSELGDANPGESDLTNDQTRGYGLRGSLMLEWPHWSIGPFFNFWDIGQSSTDCTNASCGFEPHNQTYEFGVQGRYRFNW